jgi:hypothetical protein
MKVVYVIVTVGTHKLSGRAEVRKKQADSKKSRTFGSWKVVTLRGARQSGHTGEVSVEPNCNGVEAPRQDTGSPGVRYAKLQQEKKMLVPKGWLLGGSDPCSLFLWQVEVAGAHEESCGGRFLVRPQLAARVTLRRILHREREV